MSDPRGRALERASAEDPDARAAWLRARLREGQLSPRRLALLAFLRDPGALLACPEAAPGPDHAHAPAEFFAALADLDRDAACRVALWSAEPLVEALREHASWELAPLQALSAAWDWLEEPDPARREAARVATRLASEEAQLAGERLMDFDGDPDGDPSADPDLDLALLAWGASAPARLASELRDEALPSEAREVLSELEAGHAELGRDDPLDEPLRRLAAWCLAPE